MRVILLLSDLNMFSPAIYLKFYLITHYNLSTHICLENEIDTFTDNDIVIPFDSNSSKLCYKHKIKNCLINTPELYDTLDDKKLCYYFTEKLGIKNIPTFTYSDFDTKSLAEFVLNNKHINDTFIVKHVDGLGSLKLYTHSSQELLQLDKDTFKEFVIQPYLDIKKIITIDCVCKDGIMVSCLVEEKNIFYKKDNLIKYNNNSNRTILTSKDPRYNYVYKHCEMLCKLTNYNGFNELEYIQLTDDNNAVEELLLMEINPRICGVMFTVINNKSIYVDTVVTSYIDAIKPKLISSTFKKKGKIKKLIAYNKLNKSTITNNSKKAYNFKPNLNNYIIIVGVVILLILVSVGIYKGVVKYKLKKGSIIKKITSGMSKKKFSKK
jgi:hypothetical protein